MIVKFKKFLRNYVINESSIYLEIKGTICGKNKLQEIYNFYNQKCKAQIIKNGLVIFRKQLSIICNLNQKIKKKNRTIKSKI